MPINPMQRKARNSFLLGMLVMLIIAAAIIGLLMFQIAKLKEAEQEENAALVKAYVLRSDVKSGTQITENNIILQEVNRDSAPTSDLATISDISDGAISKLDLKRGTVLSKSMISKNEEKVTNDLRMQEYNMVVLPTYLDIEEFIDIRLLLPTGQDYIVLSKKRIENVEDNTIWLQMSEAETLTMSNAIVEAYMVSGSMLYATKYIEPGMQEESSSTYTVSREVLGLINSNTNIEETARQALWARYNAVTSERESINSAIKMEGENALTNVQSGISSQIQTQKEQREKYLQSLNVGTIQE